MLSAEFLDLLDAELRALVSRHGRTPSADASTIRVGLGKPSSSTPRRRGTRRAVAIESRRPRASRSAVGSKWPSRLPRVEVWRIREAGRGPLPRNEGRSRGGRASECDKKCSSMKHVARGVPGPLSAGGTTTGRAAFQARARRYARRGRCPARRSRPARRRRPDGHRAPSERGGGPIRDVSEGPSMSRLVVAGLSTRVALDATATRRSSALDRRDPATRTPRAHRRPRPSRPTTARACSSATTSRGFPTARG